MNRKKSNPVAADFSTLRALVESFAIAAINESWKGGGDPLDVETLETRLAFERARLHAHIDRMERSALT
jgi:hypothetical protein